MAMMMGSLYDALVSANVPEDKARKAAEEVADFNKAVGEVKTELAILKVMVTLILGGVAALVIKAFF